MHVVLLLLSSPLVGVVPFFPSAAGEGTCVPTARSQCGDFLTYASLVSVNDTSVSLRVKLNIFFYVCGCFYCSWLLLIRVWSFCNIFPSRCKSSFAPIASSVIYTSPDFPFVSCLWCFWLCKNLFLRSY